MTKSSFILVAAVDVLMHEMHGTWTVSLSKDQLRNFDLQKLMKCAPKRHMSPHHVTWSAMVC